MIIKLKHHKITFLLIILFVAIFVTIYYFKPKKHAVSLENFPINNQSYNKTQKEIGCLSIYTNKQKNNIFIEKYKDHWMTWKGHIDAIDYDELHVKISGFATDLNVKFDNQKELTDLPSDKIIKIKFLMKKKGNCFFPYKGLHGKIVETIKNT